jgi:hypothetical protein
MSNRSRSESIKRTARAGRSLNVILLYPAEGPHSGLIAQFCQRRHPAFPGPEIGPCTSADLELACSGPIDNHLARKITQAGMCVRAINRGLVLGGVIMAAFVTVALGETPGGAGATTKTSAQQVFKQPSTLGELLALPAADLDKVDAGLINILCAEGLPGAEGLDVPKSMEVLDSWASLVKAETDKNYYRFVEHPELFCNSLTYYRMQMMGDVLVNQLRMQYEPALAVQSREGLNSPNAVTKFFSDSKQIFLFGLLEGDRYGTCASMPFLYLAIGRRLGYPVNLVSAPEHLFVRCEEPNGDHLNVEATAVSRFKTPPDEYYRDKVKAVDRDSEISQAGWLRPLSNKEIVGHSLFSRLACLTSAGRYDEELKTWDVAAKYLPDTPRWRETVQARKAEALDDRHLAQWTALWKQIESTPIPPGAGYVYFRDQVIKLHMVMMDGTDLATIQKAVDGFNTELAAALKPEKDGLSNNGLALATPPQTAYVSHFKFSDSGKEVIVPEDLMPPNMRNGVPEPLVNRILAQNLDSEGTILNFLWDRYEQANLATQRRVNNEMNGLVENGPRPILIAREAVPQEYWNGLPQDLALRLQGEKDPQQIIADIRAYQLEEQVQKRSQPPSSYQPPQAFNSATPTTPSPMDAYLEKQRQFQQQVRAQAYERLHPKVSLTETQFRFVPAYTINGQQFMLPSSAPISPAIPAQGTTQTLTLGTP